MGEILCIIDGMTDAQFRPADYPALSKLKLLDYVDTVKGCEPESLNCILHLLGTEQIPQNLRGYAEALGEDIPLGNDDLILRGSWFAVDANGICRHPTERPDALPAEVEGCRYYPLEQYKSILVFPGLAQAIGDIQTFPPYRCAGSNAGQYRPRGNARLEQLYDACLRQGRCLIPWGQAVPSNIAPFPMRAAMICGASIAKGIGKLLGMDVMPVRGATGDVDTDLEAKLNAALAAARQYPMVVVHINGADEAGHRRNRTEKQAFLRRVDRLVLTQLLRSGHHITVMGDHGTDPESGLHTNEKQPRFVNRV